MTNMLARSDSGEGKIAVSLVIERRCNDERDVRARGDNRFRHTYHAFADCLSLLVARGKNAERNVRIRVEPLLRAYSVLASFN